MAIKDWPGGVISKTPVVPAGSYAGSAASGVWTLDQVAYWNKQGTWPGLIPGDPYFDYVSLLLTGDGTNGAQNNTFLDSSTNKFTITRNGNTTQGTFSPYGNLWSNYFDGSGDYLTAPYNAALDLNSGDWTFDAWVYPGAPTGSYKFLWSFGPNSSNFCNVLLFDNGTNYSVQAAYVQNNTNTGFNIYPSTYNIAPNNWSHIAIQRSGTALYVYVNGVLRAYANTAANVTAIGSGTNYIGARWDASLQYTGYISNMRIVKGSAVYQTAGTTVGTAYFSPSTAPLTAVSGTSLLTCQSNRFIDNSSNNFTLTVNGNTSVQRFSPFNPPVPYSASTIGGSGYFDGTGDYLKIADNAAVQLGTSQFWYEAWIYVTTLPTTGSYIVLGGTTNGAMTVRIRAAALRVDLLNVGSWDSTSVTWQKGAWQHIAVGRDSGNTLRFFVNGEAKGTATLTNSCDGYSNSLGVNPSELSEYFPGYLCDSRLIKGSCLYTTSFTPPTTPVTAVTNTSWLCNFTNAGIPDAAMMNDLETVGNAQVSTSVKKYGTGSLAFDGTGDYLVTNGTGSLNMGTGSFTVEFWVNRSNNNCGVFKPYTNTSSNGIEINSSNKVAWWKDGSSSILESSTVLSSGTWYHIAFVRDGSSFKLYVNGVSESTTSNSDSFDFSTWNIGRGYYNNQYSGYIDDFRITKGYARYTANFTPPTAAFPTF